MSNASVTLCVSLGEPDLSLRPLCAGPSQGNSQIGLISALSGGSGDVGLLQLGEVVLQHLELILAQHWCSTRLLLLQTHLKAH